MNQCETQSKSYEETKELCETLEKEMISLMSPDLQAMFEDYKEYTLNLKQTEQRDAYIDGLAFGIRTISWNDQKNIFWIPKGIPTKSNYYQAKVNHDMYGGGI